jgi:hypothetical protein
MQSARTRGGVPRRRALLPHARTPRACPIAAGRDATSRRRRSSPTRFVLCAESSAHTLDFRGGLAYLSWTAPKRRTRFEKDESKSRRVGRAQARGTTPQQPQREAASPTPRAAESIALLMIVTQDRLLSCRTRRSWLPGGLDLQRSHALRPPAPPRRAARRSVGAAQGVACCACVCRSASLDFAKEESSSCSRF